ncbi:MAG: carboxypeptidase regulatory-like domain-containing protein [Caldilinea sp.]|nr:carboxypeptidase regulatory-like domain-containing protein [Caldilinea sp.]
MNAVQYRQSGGEFGVGRKVVLATIFFAALAVLFVTTSGVASAQTCVDDLTGVRNNCTANDVSFGQIDVLDAVTPTCAFEGQVITVTLRTRVIANASERYDIGLFIAEDGGDARTGACFHDYLRPVSNSTTYSATSGVGPFYNAELTDPADVCGDLEQGVLNVYDLQPIQVVCRDSDNDGFLDVGSVISWDNTSGNTCASAANAVPNTKAKCLAVPALRIPISVPGGALDIVKLPITPTVNAGQQVGFAIRVTNTVTGGNIQSVRLTDTLPSGITWAIGAGSDPGCSIANVSGAQQLQCSYPSMNNTGQTRQTRVVRVLGTSSIAQCPVILNRVDATWVSVSGQGSNQVLTPGQGSAFAQVNVLCSSIEVDKQTVPGGATESFNFELRQNGRLLEQFSLTDAATPYLIFPLTPTITYSVTEATPSGWSLISQTCSDGYAPSSITPQGGNTVSCTFINERQTGTIIINKTAQGGDATFDFTGPGGNLGSNFQLTTTNGSASVTFNNVPTGAYSVAEDVNALPTGWDFTGLACSDPSTDTSVTGATASIQVGYNETVNCTFTNTRRGSITVTKTVDFNGFGNDPTVVNQLYTICVEGASVSYPANCQDFSAGQSRSFGNLLPGDYLVYETAPTANEGWMITVSDGTPTVLPGEDTPVTVSNKPIQGEILIIKTVNPRFVREFEWAITKTVDPPTLDLFVGDTGDISYTLDIVRSIRQDRDFAISGTVAISNPSALPVWINQPVDELSVGGAVALDCGFATWPQRINAGAEILCTYDTPMAGTFTPADTITNSVSVSLTNSTLYTQAVPFNFTQPATLIDEEVTVVDPIGGLAEQTVSGNLLLTYPGSPTCDTFGDWQNGGNTGSYQIVNTATLSGTLVDRSDSATVTVNCYRLGVSKTAQPSYTLTSTWDITKTVSDPTVDIFAGDSQDVTYTVSVTNTGAYSGSWVVDGTITISNPAPLAANLSSIQDLLNSAYPGTISNCSPSGTAIAPFGQVTCDYSIDLSGAGAIDGTNVASAVLVNNDGSTTSFSGSQSVDFATAQVTPDNESVDVDDSFAGPLGSFSTTRATTYTRTLDCASVTGYVDGSASTVLGNTASIVQTGQSDSEDVVLTCYIPSVSKDATPSYTLTYTWQLDKVVYPPTVDLFDGANATLNYTVTATRDNGTPGTWGVTGVISVTNPHPVDSIALTGAVVDVIEGGVNASVSCPASVGPGATVTCTYNALLPNNTTRQNTATLTLFGIDYPAYADIDFAGVLPTEVNASLTVNDDYSQAGSPWTFTASSAPETYSRSVDCSNFTEQSYTNGVAGTTVTNTASATQQSGEQLSQSANVALTCYRPSVSKTAVPSHVITYTWDITKTADVAQVDLFDGDGQTVNYTIEAVRDGGTPGSWSASGTVTIVNPNPSETIPVAAVADELSGGFGAVALDCSGATVVPAASNGNPGSLACSYAVTLPDGSSRTNTATVTLYGRSYSGTADVVFNPNAANTVNDSLTVTDTIAGPWTFGTSGSQSYGRPLTCADVFGQVDYGSDGQISTDLPNTAVGRGDNDVLLDQDSETVTLTCYRPLVSKDATTSYTRTFDWTVSKVVAPSRLDLFDGETATVTYTIDVVKLPGADSAFSVAGVISITNPHPTQPATFAVADVLPGDLDATVDCGSGATSVTVGAGATATCTYSATPTAFISGTNVATATMQTDAGPRSYTGEAAVSFDANNPPTVIDNQVGINDTNAAFGGPVTTSTTFNREYTVDYGCQNVDFSQSTTVYQQRLNTVTVDKTVDASDTATVDLYCYRPTVTKTAQGAYGETYDWTLVKSADPARLDLFEGESQVVTYTIDAVKTLVSQADFVVSGGIAISNPNPARSLSLTSVVDQLNTGQTLPNNCAASVPAGQILNCSYGGSVTSVNATSVVTNTATITTAAGRSYASAPQSVDFGQVQPSTLYNSVTIEDTQTPQTWQMSASGPISYTLVQGCANVAFAGDSTTYNATLANTASVRELVGRTSTATVDLNCYRLRVNKDASTSFTRQYFWDIAKTVEPATWDIFVGDQVTSTYTVTASIVGQQDSAWQVDGSITISNPAPMSATVTSVVDVLPNGVNATVNCAQGGTLGPNSSVTCSYSGLPGGVIDGNNVATVTLQTSAGSNEYAGTAPVVFGAPTTELSKTVDVTDNRVGPLGAFSNGQSKSYPTNFSCANVVFGEGATSAGYTYDNTAAIDGTAAFANASVSVTCWKPPVVKTANTSYNRVFDYDIVKTADPLEQTIYFTDTATFGYTLQVTKFVKEENGFAVGGTIVIANPAPIDANLATIEDILPDAANMTIACSPDDTAPYTVPAGGQLICTYSAGLPDKSLRINEARVTMTNGTVVSDTADVNFDQAVVKPINDSANITDTYFSQVWTVGDSTQTNYSQSFTCEGATFDEQSGFFRKVLTNVAAVLLPGGDTDSATVTLNCYQLGLVVQKTATPTELPEPGGEFTFEVVVVNNSPMPVTVTSINDSVYGDLTQVTGRMTGTTCALPQTPLAANGGQYSCSFTANVTGQPGFSETDVVTVFGQDGEGNTVSSSDDATVTLTDTPASIAVSKTANVTSLPFPGGLATFTVAAQNTSAVDAVTLEAITDTVYGNVTQVTGNMVATTCVVPQNLAAGETYSCTFTVNLTIPADATTNFVETNVVTVTGTGDDGDGVEGSDDETVTVIVAPTATIGDRVFVDINPDGANSAEKVAGNQQQDFANGQPVESNVAGIDVLLFAADGTLIAQTQTDANGDYQFTDVPPGDYYVVFVNNSFQGVWTSYNAQIADDVNSDVDPTLPLDAQVQSVIDNIFGPDAEAARTPTFTIQPGQTYLDVDAGLIDLSGVGSVDISGLVWFDVNRDGIRQPEEVQRVPGILVELYKVDSSQPDGIAKVDSMTTLADGSYAFTGLDAGVYFIKVTVPNNRISPQDAGSDDNIDSDVDPLTGESQPVLLTSVEATLDIGVHQIPTALDPGDEPFVGTARLYLPAVQR